MVCWTVDEEPVVNSATTATDSHARTNSSTMDVQRAKKCKLWSGDEELPYQEKPKPIQPPLPADPCPTLEPFFHQVTNQSFCVIKSSTTTDFISRDLIIVECNYSVLLWIRKSRSIETFLYLCHFQVGGHTQFLLLDQSTVCKPLIPRELSFYLNAPPEIRTFTPQCKGNTTSTIEQTDRPTDRETHTHTPNKHVVIAPYGYRAR